MDHGLTFHAEFILYLNPEAVLDLFLCPYKPLATSAMCNKDHTYSNFTPHMMHIINNIMHDHIYTSCQDHNDRTYASNM